MEVGQDQHPTHREGSAGMGRDLWGIRGSEGNEASVSLDRSNPSKAAGVLGLNLSPLGPPWSMLSLSPAPIPPRAFSGCVGLEPRLCPHPSPIPPKPHPSLSPTPHGPLCTFFSFFFFAVVVLFCLVVVPFIFLFFLIYF